MVTVMSKSTNKAVEQLAQNVVASGHKFLFDMAELQRSSSTTDMEVLTKKMVKALLKSEYVADDYVAKQLKEVVRGTFGY